MTQSLLGDKRRQDLVLAAGLCLAAALFAALYVALEHPAYSYDWGMYWRGYQNAGRALVTNPLDWPSNVILSIRSDDYNYSPTVLLMPPYLLFGGGRTAYVAAISALYVAPAAWLASRLVPSRTPSESYLRLFAAITFPVFWNAALRGMPDVVGLIPLALAMIRIRESAFMTKATPAIAVWTGVLLWMSFLFRRWYAFSAVALVALSVCAAAIILLTMARSQNNLPRRETLTAIRNWCLVAAGAVVPLCLLQDTLTWRILSTNYADIYSAYQADAVVQFSRYWGWFGPAAFLLAAMGAAADVRRGAWWSSFCLAAAGVTILLFAHVQAPSIQHLLPVALLLFPAYSSGAVAVWSALPRGMKLAVPALLALLFVNAFAPDRPGPLAAVRNLLLATRTPPLHLDHYAEYQRLLSDLNALDPGTKITIFAAAPDCADTLFASLAPAILPRLIGTSVVDLRDGFKWDVLTADYAVVTDPTALHLNPGDQRVITFPAEEIKSGQGIGASYRFVRGGYQLDGGYVAALYKRERQIPREDLQHLAERFRQYYPDWKGPP